MRIDRIGLAKIILWENAKGKLRAISAVSKQLKPDETRFPYWGHVENAIETFIKDFEEKGLQK